MSDCELEALLEERCLGGLLGSSATETASQDVPSEASSPRRKKLKTEDSLSRPQVKARREKARRERINKRFDSLAKLSNPEEPKTDKASILLDALFALKTTKMENDQLKQLNKFLEEKVANYEKDRSFALYQQSMVFSSVEPYFSGGVQVPEGTVLGTPAVPDAHVEVDVDAFLHPPAA